MYKFPNKFSLFEVKFLFKKFFQVLYSNLVYCLLKSSGAYNLKISTMYDYDIGLSFYASFPKSAIWMDRILTGGNAVILYASKYNDINFIHLPSFVNFNAKYMV